MDQITDVGVLLGYGRREATAVFALVSKEFLGV